MHARVHMYLCTFGLITQRGTDSRPHLGGAQGDLDVAALDGEHEARALVLHEMQRDLGEALGLQVGDNGLPAQLTAPDHGQHLVELALQQRQLEHVLRRVHLCAHQQPTPSDFTSRQQQKHLT